MQFIFQFLYQTQKSDKMSKIKNLGTPSGTGYPLYLLRQRLRRMPLLSLVQSWQKQFVILSKNCIFARNKYITYEKYIDFFLDNKSSIWLF